MNIAITGSKGGGKGGGSGSVRVPVEAKDSLRSKAFANVLDAVSEGEIGGLVNGLNSVYLDGTPIQNTDGSYNFTGVELESRTGSQAQAYIPGFAAVESTSTVAIKVTEASSVTRQVTNSNVNAVRVTIGIPQLSTTDTKNGDLNGASVHFSIDLQSNGGGFAEVVSDEITGKSTTRYQRSYRVELTGSGPWDVRVRRRTADSTSVSVVNETWWDAITEIVDAKLRYPNTALVGLKVDSSQFQSIPTRGYDMKLLKVRLPSNYNPTTRAYTGSWDGTFQIAWSDNPAWCFYDLLTNSRYGLGGLVDETQVDKWALYQIGRYCDELVPDGFGATEPRFACNIYLQTRADAYKVLQDFASIFRGMAYWATGAVTAVQDAPSDPVALFTGANVIGGQFAYSGSSLKARHTVALVTWNDPADLYRQKVEYVEDETGIARYGVQQTSVLAVGCTSRGQANRVGRWLLYSERSETETTSFSVGLDGAVVRPGNVILVADSNRAAARLGGRVALATLNSITVDKAPALAISGWTIYAMLSNGEVEARTISSLVGNVISVTTEFSSSPIRQGVWVISSPTVEAQYFRVVQVTEDQDSGNYAITALRHEPLKYDAIELGLVLQPRDYTLLNDPPATPTGGALTEYLYSTLTDVRVGVVISWDATFRAVEYQVTYKIGQNNLVTVTTKEPQLELLDAREGQYSVTIRSVSATGYKSIPLEIVKTVFGKSAPPSDIAGLQMTVQGDTGLLQWDLHADLDVRIGGQIVARYSESTVAPSWNTALQVGEFHGGATSGVVAMRSGSYLVKARDSQGNYSTNVKIITTDAPNIMQFNAVASSTQEPAFTGTKTGMVMIGDRLVLDNSTYFDDITDLDTYTTSLDAGLVQSGSYEFDTYVDTGAVYTSRVSASFAVVTYNADNLVDAWPLIDTLGGIDEGSLYVIPVDDFVDWDTVASLDAAATTGDATVQFYIATTSEDPVASPVWSDWRTFVLGDYTARAFKFKMAIDRGSDTNNQVAISRLGVTVDVPDRVESANNIATAIGGADVIFQNAFFVTPAIAVTAENLATGDYAVITAKSSTGFTIQFKNSAGTGVVRTFDWIAKGYGYQN